MKIEAHLQGGLRKIIDITPGATVGATIGTNVFNPDGSLFVPASGGNDSQLSITSWELILNIPPNVTALANATGTGFFSTISGSGAGVLRSMQGPQSVKVTDGDGIAGNPSFALDGDVLSPGGMYSYATDLSGTKGWFRPALFESTGLLAWSAPYLAINGSDPTKFDVGAAVVGYTDYSTNPVAPTRAYAVYGPTTGNAVPSLANIATWIGVQTPGGTLVMQTTAFTPTQRRTIVQLGTVISNGTQLIAVNALPVVMRAGINQISDLMTAVGPINTGNLVGPNGANLQINKGAGVVFKEGANFANNPDDPHNLPLAALTAANFNYRTSTGVQAATTNAINVTQYESPLGTLATVPNNRFTVQRVYVFTSNLIRIQYGQTVYQTMAEAEAAIATQAFATEANIAGNGVLLAFLIVEKSATALNNAAQAKFIPADKFGGVVGSGGTSITNTDSLPEGVVNLYYTDTRARAAVIAATIVNGDTTHSPNGDAVFDALATKEPTIAAGTTAQFWRGDKSWSNELRGDMTFRNTSVNNEYKKLVTTATMANENLMGLNAYGANGSADAIGGTVNMRASEVWTSTANGCQFEVRLVAPGTTTLAVRMRVFGTGTVAPAADNTQKLGEASLRWSEVFAGNGTINTSDQREKTSPRDLNKEEIACASDLARLPSIFQWLHAIQAKGDDARLHCSPTVQAVISCMERHGLDPFRYGFVCYDQWDEMPEVWDEWPAQDAVLDDEGNTVKEAVEAGREIVQEYRPAGDRYSLRPSELQFFIARGQEERIRRLEALLNL